MNGFGEKLKRLREKAGLTQEGLARNSNMSTSFISKLEREGIDPSWSAVVNLAAALGVDCTAFSGCEDVAGVESVKPAVKPAGKPSPKKKGGKK